MTNVQKKTLIKDILEVLAASLIIVLIIINYIFIPCKVDGSSMHPTLKDNDIGLSFVVSKNIEINRFDICVIEHDGRKLVKRLIGLPGETIEYKDDKLFINGEFFEETYIQNVSTPNLKITLQEDEYYCLGDNREVSLDSRYYGPFNKEDIKSTHFLVLFPFKDAGMK